LGRYPFVTEFRSYLRYARAFYKPSTLERLVRNLRTCQRDLQELHANGRITTTNPRKLTEEDILELLRFWQERPSRRGTPLDPATQAKYLSDLEGLLEFCDNHVLDALRRKKIRMPRQIEKPIEVLTKTELARLRQAAESMEGWAGAVARFLVAILPASGLRRKELRLARIQDLDTRTWRIRIVHPKGEGSWASSDFAPILPPARQDVLDFLEERRAALDRWGAPGHEALIPYRRRNGDVDYFPDPMLGKLKAELNSRGGAGWPST